MNEKTGILIESKFEMNQTLYYYNPNGEPMRAFVVEGAFYQKRLSEDGKTETAILFIFDRNGQGYAEKHCFATKEEVQAEVSKQIAFLTSQK